jgi:hypothetical protein
MFTPDERAAVVDRILAFSRMDSRIAGAAVVGSLAHGPGDRWSDVDLTFAVADNVAVTDVLTDWTAWIGHEFDGVALFDLPSGDTIYRVFLLPAGLQVDLSFTPAAKFASGGPRFRLVFGETHPKAPPLQPDPGELFGWGLAYARGARAEIERGRLWQAEHEMSAVRDNALAIACLARGLPSRYGRGYDDLPADLLARFEGTFVAAPITRDALLPALRSALEGLLREAAATVPIAEPIAASAREWLADG